MPAFRELVTEAGASSVMGAYNRFRGQQCCASDELKTKILREYRGFDGYITPDCGAITDFYHNHKTHPARHSSAADAVIHTMSTLPR